MLTFLLTLDVFVASRRRRGILSDYLHLLLTRYRYRYDAWGSDSSGRSALLYFEFVDYSVHFVFGALLCSSRQLFGLYGH